MDPSCGPKASSSGSDPSCGQKPGDDGKKLPSRTKVYPKIPEQAKEKSCEGDCKNINRHDTNQYRWKWTCMDCGKGAQGKVVGKPTHDPDTCPHDDVDRRGSSSLVAMIYCKQCCTVIDARSQTKAKEYRKISEGLARASTAQQRLAKSLLEE